jgi:hypothetical protein
LGIGGAEEAISNNLKVAKEKLKLKKLELSIILEAINDRKLLQN